MKAVGRIASRLALFLLPQDSQELKQRLASTYASFRLGLKLKLPPILVRSLLAAEDHRFERHLGVDLWAVARAVWCTFIRGKIAGGSTIEQQLVRNLTKQYDRSLRRKLREMLLASVVHEVIPKPDIPGVYLQVAYFGSGMNGIRQACARLRLDLSNLSSRQAAGLVARLKYPEPETWSLGRSKQIAARTRYILTLLAAHPQNLPGIQEDVKDRAAVPSYPSC